MNLSTMAMAFNSLISKQRYTAFLVSVLFAVMAPAHALCQKKNKPTSFFIGVNRISVSTGGGDPIGIAIAPAVQKKMSKTLVLELLYQLAHARTKHSLSDEFAEKTFHYLEPSISYHPFNHCGNALAKQLAGFYVSTGPSIFTGTKSEQVSFVSEIDDNGMEVERLLRLRYKNMSDVGYTVKLGYQLIMTNRLLVGLRCTFANYASQDGYFAIGVTIGVEGDR